MPPSFESKYRMSEAELEQLLRPRLDESGRNASSIARFFGGRSAFVTGATGFVGRLLVEKLLRACPSIKRIYVLVRAKRDKSASERVKELTGSFVFDGIRDQMNLEEKLVGVEGNLVEHTYGFSEKILKQLAEEVSVIFHSAASVNFQEPLRDATLTNLVGACNALRLAKKLPKVVALVYVSTAYSNCIHKPEVQERVYPSKMDPKVLMNIAGILDRETMEIIKRYLVEPYPNTYTFTKNMAENLCLKFGADVPIVICRPSVVVSTWREPVQGFVDNINGGNGINYGPASGLSVTMQADNSIVMDYVPVDVVVNCIIVCAWFCANYWEERLLRLSTQPSDKTISGAPSDEQKSQLTIKMRKFHERNLQMLREAKLPESFINVPVFHITSGVENPIKVGTFKDIMVKYANKYPTLQLYRCPRMVYLRSKVLFEINRFFQNTLVAKLMDCLNQYECFMPEIYFENDPIVKKKLAFRSERIDHFGQTIVYFLTNHWDFQPNNRLMLIDEFMSDEDKRLFNFDMRQLDWENYCEIYALGIRKFLLKEPIQTVERARSRMGLICVRNTTVQLVLVTIILYFFLSIF